VLLDPPRPARVIDDAGRPVLVTERGAVPHPPARFALGNERPVAVESWAGPWPVDERWWSAESARHVVRCQLVDVRGRAYLVSGTMPPAADPSGAGGQPSWQVEAIYD
jgi:protein ImuB